MLNKEEIKEYRIHDSIAKILSQGSICMAIAEIAGNYYIAANEVNSQRTGKKFIESAEIIKNYVLDRYVNNKPEMQRIHTRFKTQHAASIKTIQNLNYGTFYFDGKFCKTIRLNGALIEKDFNIAENSTKEKILQQALTGKIIRNNLSELIEGMWKLENVKFLFGQNASIYTTTLHKTAREVALNARKAIKNKQHRLINIDELKLNIEVGDNAPVVAFGATSMMQIEDHARKVMEQCKTDSKFAKKFTEIAWVYSSVSKVKGEAHPKIHAEMKVLSKILEELDAGKLGIKTEIYIGISKSCCFHCHHSLEAANVVLAKNGIQIKYREAHDITFGGRGTKEIPDPVTGWSFPFEASEKNMKKIYKNNDTIEIVKAILAEASTRFKNNNSQQDVSMDHSMRSQSPIPQNSSLDSYSEDSTKDENVVEAYKLSLNDLKKKYESLPHVSKQHSYFVKRELEEINMLLNYSSSCKDKFLIFLEMSVDHIDPINMFNNITKELTLNNKEIEVLLRAFQGENAHHKIKKIFENSKIENFSKEEDRVQLVSNNPLSYNFPEILSSTPNVTTNVQTLQTSTTTTPGSRTNFTYQHSPEDNKNDKINLDKVEAFRLKGEIKSDGKKVYIDSSEDDDSGDHKHKGKIKFDREKDSLDSSEDNCFEEPKSEVKIKDKKLSYKRESDSRKCFIDLTVGNQADSITTTRKRKMPESKDKFEKKIKLNQQLTTSTNHIKENSAERNSLPLFKNESGSGVKLHTLASLANKEQIFETKKGAVQKGDALGSKL